MLQLVFEDVAIAVFGCSNIPPIDIDECCKKHGANVAAEFFLVLQELTFTVADIFFICFRCYVFILWWSDGASDGSNVQALALPIKMSSLYGTSSAPHMLIGKDVYV